jgi:alkanesulfonate monooxygenase SsuD/methylene tetrahydromethanopterin reductase-like flavin-dependent oxidoreductase (luciferase family)
MLDNLMPDRLVVGLLRGTTGEYLSYGLNPAEARERTTEAMELILKAWTEPQPFGWQGRHFQFRTVSVWPRPLQQPHPPTYALGASRESCEVAARHHLGLGVAYGPFEQVGKATRYYRDACAGYGWQPAPEQIIYRANILLTQTDEEARGLLETQRAPRDSFPLRAGVREALLQLDSRNIAGEARSPTLGGVLPRNFFGSPDTVVDQIKRCREATGAGVVDLMFQVPDTADLSFLMRSLELFGKNVLPHIRDV